MADSELKFFTQIVDGQIYGAWYRRLEASDWIEVLGVGMIKFVQCAYGQDGAVARNVLEEFVRLRSEQQAPVPSIGSMSEPQGTDDATAETE